ncbi:MAG: hypothetical protein V2I63_11445 [Pseudomonadales bacterium]|jgi:hypothetical protein|nr:hypothetical protein [Pseudomonadales bacterium]
MTTSSTRPPSARSDALERLSAALGPACLLLAILLPSAVLWNWFAIGPTRIAAQAGIALPADFLWWQWLLGTGLALTPVGFMASALLAARRCFMLFRAGRCLQRETSEVLRIFGLRVLYAGIAGLLVPTLLIAVLTGGSDPQHIRWEIHMGSSSLLAVVFGGMLAAMACVLDRAVTIAEEHAQII